MGPPSLASLFENGKGIQFRIKTGGNEYLCTLQDRKSYERKKAQNADSSADSVQTRSTTPSAEIGAETSAETSTTSSTNSSSENDVSVTVQ